MYSNLGILHENEELWVKIQMELDHACYLETCFCCRCLISNYVTNIFHIDSYIPHTGVSSAFMVFHYMDISSLENPSLAIGSLMVQVSNGWTLKPTLQWILTCNLFSQDINKLLPKVGSLVQRIHTFSRTWDTCRITSKGNASHADSGQSFRDQGFNLSPGAHPVKMSQEQ